MLKKLGRVRFQGNAPIQQKQLHSVAYFSELGYDIAIPLPNRMSRITLDSSLWA
jgi:hypothetical protein